jgi:hypothetical protein
VADLLAAHVGGVVVVRLPAGAQVRVGDELELECSLAPGAPSGPAAEFVAARVRRA